MRITGDRISVKMSKTTTTLGGIVLPQTMQGEDVKTGVVIGVGRGENVNLLDVKPGDTVVFTPTKLDLHNPMDKEEKVIPAAYVYGVL